MSSSCVSPTLSPRSESIVSLPTILSLSSALKKFPPAITVPDVFVVLETSILAAEEFVPKNTISLIPEFKVIPGLIDENPDCSLLGVKAALCDKIATLVPPAYIDETTLSPPELAIVSITNPDSPCDAV